MFILCITVKLQHLIKKKEIKGKKRVKVKKWKTEKKNPKTKEW